jgi:acyl-CoA dehydrogenase
MVAAMCTGYRAAWLEREGRPCGVEATMAKARTAELATAGADMGIQILGGYGYAQEYDMQRYWRDVRLYRIGPISTEMSKTFIGESLGLPRSFWSPAANRGSPRPPRGCRA